MNKILMVLAVVMMGCGGVTEPSEPPPTSFDYGWPENPAVYPIEYYFSVHQWSEWGIATNLETFWIGEFDIVDGVSSDYDIYFHHEYCQENDRYELWATYTGRNAFTTQITGPFQIEFPCDNWIIPVEICGAWSEYPDDRLTYWISIGYPYQK